MTLTKICKQIMYAVLALLPVLAQAAPVPVSVAAVRTETVPVTVSAVGNAEAYATVSVRSRVDGQIDRVFIRDGQRVKAGERLFEIDQRPFRVQVAQAEANLQKAKAELDNAAAQQKRYQALSKEQFVSEEDAEQIRTNLESAKASVAASEAALESAKLQLDYTTITAPITGRTGPVELNKGSVVRANDSAALVVIRQLRPIYVSFSVPEHWLARIRRRNAADPLAVQVTSRGGASATGKLSFIDNTVDTTTGTIRMKATFANDDDALWPGQFMQVVLTLGQQPDALVVPSEAVETGQNGAYVFVLGADNTVSRREITVGRPVGDDVVIDEGLHAGEKVVTHGQLRLLPGAKVSVQSGGGS